MIHRAAAKEVGDALANTPVVLFMGRDNRGSRPFLNRLETGAM